MSQKAITIQTPDWEAPHITADDDAFIYASLAGVQSGILGDLTCVKVDNNTVRLSGGGVMNRGHILRIPADEVLELTVDSGTAGYKRYDVVAAEFVKGGGEVADSFEIKIIKGLLSTTEPPMPTMTTSDLIDSGDINQIALFKLQINGTTMSVAQRMIDTIQDANAEQLTNYAYTRIGQRSYREERGIRYGIKINKLESDPEARITYIYDAEGMTPAHMDFDNGVFDYGSWENVFFVRENRPVMLNLDRTVAYELNHNDYSKKTTGTASDIDDEDMPLNAMSEFPLIWLCQYEIDNYEYVIVSNIQYDETYRADAYTREDGTIARYMYLPMFGGSYDGTKLRSLSGKALSDSNNANTQISQAAANGSGWTIIPWCRRNLINCLLLIMGKSENSNAVFGQGVQSYSINTGKPGTLNSGTLDDKGQFYGYSDITHQVKVFHIEKWWGDKEERIAGLINDYGWLKVKMSPPYNTTGEDYEPMSFDLPSSSDWQKNTIMTEYGRFPTESGDGATSSTYLCAYVDTSARKLALAVTGGSHMVWLHSAAGSIDLDNPQYNPCASISCESPIDAVIPELYEGGKDAEAREELELLKSNFQVATMAEYQQAIGDDW